MEERASLTEPESRLYEYLRRELRAGRGVPSWPDIAREMAWKSTRSVGYYLERLDEKGYIRRRPGQRGIELLGEPTGFAVPVVSLVAAGEPLAPSDGPLGWFEFERVFGGEDVVLFQVRGESMIESHIAPGDFVAVHRGAELTEGRTVIAQIDGELTLKVYRMIRGKPWLYPRNANVKPIRLETASDPRLVGALLGVIRKV